MLLICCGMPRSGSTLQFNIAWKVAEAGGIGRRIEWRSSDDWASADAELADMAADERWNVIKMHFPPDSVKRLSDGAGTVRFFYVHRDIRDVVYSMKTKFKFTLSRAIRRVSDSLEAEAWLLDRQSGDVLIEDYSALLNDLPGAVVKAAGFLGVSLDRAQIDAIASELSLEQAYTRSRREQPMFEHFWRRLNRLLGRNISFADNELMLHPNHVSEHKGRVGIGQERLSGDDLDAIAKAFGARVHGLVHDR